MKVSTVFVLGLTLITSNTLVPNLIADANSEAPQEQKQVIGFHDVEKDHWTYNAVSVLCDAGIIESVFKHRVKESTPVSRYEFAVMLGRLIKPQQANTKVKYEDIPKIVTQRLKISQSQTQKPGDEQPITKEEYDDALRQLFFEFQTELRILGIDYRDRSQY